MFFSHSQFRYYRTFRNPFYNSRSDRFIWYDFFKTRKVPESDAEKSNVMVNDIIACINGIELRNESIHECANLMGNSKEYVDFKLKRVAQNKE